MQFSISIQSREPMLSLGTMRWSSADENENKMSGKNDEHLHSENQSHVISLDMEHHPTVEVNVLSLELIRRECRVVGHSTKLMNKP